VKKRPITSVLRKSLLSGKGEKSLKEILRRMPPAGEDTDFERVQDFGRDEDCDSDPP
jgi:hypothetical protein